DFQSLKPAFFRDPLNGYGEVLEQSSLRSVITRASDYFRWQVQGIPLSTPLEPQQKDWNQWKDELLRAYQMFGEVLYNMPLPLIHHGNPEKSGEKSGIEGGEDNTSPLDRSPLDQHWDNLEEDWKHKKYDTPHILSDTDDIGKLMTIVAAFDQCKALTVEQLPYGNLVLPEHICISTATQSTALGFLGSTGNAFTSRIKNFNQLVLKNKNIRFRLTRDVQHPEVKRGSVGHDEMLRLKAATNGDYVPMDRDDRITFECLHQLITDFENRDLTFETSIPEIVDWMTAKLPDYWIIRACS
ncbi:MAG: DNA polymerase III, partial [Prochlorothrix sp.]